MSIEEIKQKLEEGRYLYNPPRAWHADHLEDATADIEFLVAALESKSSPEEVAEYEAALRKYADKMREWLNKPAGKRGWKFVQPFSRPTPMVSLRCIELNEQGVIEALKKIDAETTAAP